MASKAQIVNIGLVRIGSNLQVANIDTETSRPAIAARLIWDDDVRYVLRAFPWPWARAFATLALVGGTASTPVNNRWQYSYRYPSNCLFARQLIVEGAERANAKPPPFQLGRDSQGRLIFTDEAEAELEYTVEITDPGEFDSMFVSMLAWKIGAGLAPSLSRIDGMEKKCTAMFLAEKAIAEATALNESQQDEPLEAEAIRARD